VRQGLEALAEAVLRLLERHGRTVVRRRTGSLQSGVVPADTGSSHGTRTPDEAAVTPRQIALVCCAAGLVVAGAIIVVEAIENRLYPCAPPDPYFPELCMAPGWAYLGIIVACWLLATCLVAWREAIGGHACVFMGLMLWFGIAAGVALSHVVNDTPPFGIRSSVDLLVVPLGVLIAVPVIGAFTAVVGYPMQFFIQDWREWRVGALR
jgi:hypothetical protein